MTNCFCTHHSIDRAKERINLNEKKALRNITIALERGNSSEHYNSTMEKTYLENRNIDGIALAYNNVCYIFNYQGECITVYPLPKWWEKKKMYNGKEKIRNPKKYFNFYNC